MICKKFQAHNGMYYYLNKTNPKIVSTIFDNILISMFYYYTYFNLKEFSYFLILDTKDSNYEKYKKNKTIR